MKRILLTIGLVLTVGAARGQSNVVRTVMAMTHAGGKWAAFPTRTLEDLPPEITSHVDAGFDQYGGSRPRRPEVKATGFFHPLQKNGRWWLVDPEGCLYLAKGVNSVRMVRGPEADARLKQAFGSETNWAAQTTEMLRTNGFNCIGSWSDFDLLRAAPRPMPYTRMLNLMSGYGRQRGGLHAEPGHAGYPHNCIFVFDPGFETYCDSFAKQLAAVKDDPWLIGYFSDNEMPLYRTAARDYLSLPPDEPGYQAASKWLQARHGNGATVKDITPADEQDFLALVVGRYFRIVSAAIKKYDPNHLLLGSRFHGRVVAEPEVFKAAGPYVDVISVNLYNVWTPSQDRLAMWSRASERPVLITEWYVKGADTGLANTGGAGWIVKTQADRGRFYQNFALGLLQAPGCVGWNWFKYADDDPADTLTDAANRNSNKGMLDYKYFQYTPVIDAMKRLNDRAYGLADYFNLP